MQSLHSTIGMRHCNILSINIQDCLNDADPCMCFENVPAVPASCNPGELQTETKKKLKMCKSAFSSCSRTLKEAGPYVDQCECDCMVMTTVAPGRIRRDLLDIKWQ